MNEIVVCNLQELDEICTQIEQGEVPIQTKLYLSAGLICGLAQVVERLTKLGLKVNRHTGTVDLSSRSGKTPQDSGP